MLLDTSALVDLFVPSANDERIRLRLQAELKLPVISDFAAGEFAGAMKRRYFMKMMDHSETVDMLGRFELWSASNADLIATEAADVRLAAAFVRRLDISLRMPDAMHIAQAHRLGVPLCSFDVEQISAAVRLGVAVVDFD
jgi:uncharacterized protein